MASKEGLIIGGWLLYLVLFFLSFRITMRRWFYYLDFWFFLDKKERKTSLVDIAKGIGVVGALLIPLIASICFLFYLFLLWIKE